jgi:hypothetical protein
MKNNLDNNKKRNTIFLYFLTIKKIIQLKNEDNFKKLRLESHITT